MNLINVCQWRSVRFKKPCDEYITGGFCSRSDMFRCIEYLARNTPELSYSAIRDYTRCKRKFLYSWVMGLEPVEKSRPLYMGSLASSILNVLHNDKNSIEESVLQYRDIIMNEIEKSRDLEDPDDEGDQDLWAMKGFFDGYIACEKHTIRGKPEYEFRWKEPDYPVIHGFIDLLTTFETIAYEFKWTTNPDFYNRLKCQEQSSAYFIGAPDIQAITWVLLCPPSLRPKKEEYMPEYCKRVEQDVLKRMETHYMTKKTYWRTEFDLDMYKEKAKLIAKQIMSDIQKSSDVSNLEWLFYQNTSGCYAPSQCEFLPVCTAGVLPLDQYKKLEEKKDERITQNG